jgi:PAS domain S-box-containing protein
MIATTQAGTRSILRLGWCARPDGSAEFVDAHWCTFTGMRAEDGRDWGWTSALDPADVGDVVAQWQRIVASRRPGELDVRLRGQDGTYRWFAFRLTPSLGEDGAVVRWYGTATDVDTYKCAEAAMRTSEEAFRSVLRSLPGYVCTADTTGRLDYVSDEFLAYSGRTLEESRDWAQDPLLVHPDDRTLVAERWTRSAETGQPYDVEHRIIGADGVYRWFHVLGIALRDIDGRIARWCILLDESFGASEAANGPRTWPPMVESIPGMITVHGRDGRLLYVNQELLTYLGTTFADVLNFGWTHRLHPDDVDTVTMHYLRSLEESVPMDVTFRIRRADGTLRWCHSRKEPLRDEHGEVIRWFSQMWDIDERKQAELALQASERELQLLVDSFPGMVAIVSADGRSEYANRRLLEFVGTDLDTLRRVGLEERIHPADLPELQDRWRHCLAEIAPMDMVHRLRRVDGVHRWVHSRMEPLVDDRGTVLRWYALMVDVDDQRSSEAALRATQASLAHVTRVLTVGELTASIAHEVRQPLTAIVYNANACLGLLPDDAPHLDEVREALSDIVDDAGRANAVVAGVRQLAQNGPGERTLLDVSEVIAEVLAFARHESSNRHVAIRIEVPADLPLVAGDRVQLQQVLLNLIVNGMDAMHDIDESQRVLTIGGRRETVDGTPSAVVSVRDAGVGFPPDDADRLFDAFYTTKPQGMGMGLAISRSIIGAHGGRLWAESNDDAGATFAFSLPDAGGTNAPSSE